MNFVTAHDGFTLRDVVSYDHKHNEANGENNADASVGIDRSVLEPRLRGPTDDLEIRSCVDAPDRPRVSSLCPPAVVPGHLLMLYAGDEPSRNGRCGQQSPGQQLVVLSAD